MDRFVAGEIDTVRVAYMRFESNAGRSPRSSSFRWSPTTRASTPVRRWTTSSRPTRNRSSTPAPAGGADFLFQAYNDAVVSEQIMRMIAMKAATDNAAGLGRSLKRDYNRARQARITTELTEIVSGAAAALLSAHRLREDLRRNRSQPPAPGAASILPGPLRSNPSPRPPGRPAPSTPRNRRTGGLARSFRPHLDNDERAARGAARCRPFPFDRACRPASITS